MDLSKETSSLKQISQGCAGLQEIRIWQRGTSDQQQVRPADSLPQKFVHRRPQQAFGPIALDGIPDRQASAHSDTHTELVRFHNIQYNKRVGIGFAGTPHPLEIG